MAVAAPGPVGEAERPEPAAVAELDDREEPEPMAEEQPTDQAMDEATEQSTDQAVDGAMDEATDQAIDGASDEATEPITDEATTDEPTTEPMTDEASADEPATIEASADEPAADEPAADEPVQPVEVPAAVAMSTEERAGSLALTLPKAEFNWTPLTFAPLEWRYDAEPEPDSSIDLREPAAVDLREESGRKQSRRRKARR